MVRKQCLYDLKSLGYQVGAGFMVGSPYQTAETLADDLVFLKELEPRWSVSVRLSHIMIRCLHRSHPEVCH